MQLLCDMKMKKGYKIKGYQSLKLYTANDIPMGLTHFNESSKSLCKNEMNKTITKKQITVNELHINEQTPSNSSLNLTINKFKVLI